MKWKSQSMLETFRRLQATVLPYHTRVVALTGRPHHLRLVLEFSTWQFYPHPGTARGTRNGNLEMRGSDNGRINESEFCPNRSKKQSRRGSS